MKKNSTAAAVDAKKKYCVSGEFGKVYRTDDFREAVLYYKSYHDEWNPMFIDRDGFCIVDFDGYEDIPIIRKRHFTKKEREIWDEVYKENKND